MFDFKKRYQLEWGNMLYKLGSVIMIHASEAMLFDQMEIGVGIYNLNGQVLYSNAVASKYGSSLCPDSSNEPLLFYPDGMTPLTPEENPIKRLLSGEQSIQEKLWFQPRGKHGAGHIVIVTGKRTGKEEDGSGKLLILTQDYTESFWEEKRSFIREQRYQSMFEYNPDPIFWLDLEGSIIRMNAKAEAITGFSEERLRGHTFRRFMTETEAQRAQKLLRMIHHEPAQHFDTTISHINGTLIDLHMKFIPIRVQQQMIGVYAIAQDVTARKHVESTIRHLAYHDTLTGLPNRLYFSRLLSETLERSADNGERAAILFVDLDRFKQVNDTLGHLAGDNLIQQAAKRIHSKISHTGTLARLSGDEFTLIIPNATRWTAERAAQDMIEALSTPILIEHHPISVALSIGISMYPEDGAAAETLLKHADIAMYGAKERGHNHYLFFDRQMDEAMRSRTLMENEMRGALVDRQYTLHYQPKVDMRTRRIVGMEALVRWAHPERGLVLPMEFLPIAEETGFVVQLGEWVLREACLQNKAWQAAGYPPVRIAVNLTMRQFQDNSLVQMVDRVLQETGLEGRYLELEVAESIGLHGMDAAIAKLHALKRMGVRISIDNFGTGYSSLYDLKLLPIDGLKIDRSFVRNMAEDLNGESMMRSILSLARSLRLDVLAEGVEQLSEARQLQEMGCDRMQGFLFVKPGQADEIKSTLELLLNI